MRAFVASFQTFVEAWCWATARASYWEVHGKWSSALDRIDLSHFYAFENGGFVQVEPITLEGEWRGE